MQERIFEQYAYTLDCLADEPGTDDPEVRCRLLRVCANGMRDAQKIVAALSTKTLAEELVLHGLVDRVAIEDPEGYDDGKTAHAIQCLSERMKTPNIQVQAAPCLQGVAPATPGSAG